MLVQFENVALEVREEPTHEWLLETALVADGYQVEKQVVKKHLQRNADEFVEGKHFVRWVQNVPSNEPQIFFTKKGVIRLGFFIKSARAKKFRDWAEDLIVAKQEVTKPLTTLDMLEMSIKQLREQESRVTAIEAKVLEIEAKTTTRPEYFTVMGYAILSGAKVGLSLAAQIGKKAKMICSTKGYHIDKIHDPRFGQVGCYPADVLKEVFNTTTFA
jgi:prophage antirepressor-like protein